jgi:hypothetical protein
LFEAARDYGERLLQTDTAPGSADRGLFYSLIADKGDALVAEIYAVFQSKRAEINRAPPTDANGEEAAARR